jgi:hypothetical protein
MLLLPLQLLQQVTDTVSQLSTSPKLVSQPCGEAAVPIHLLLAAAAVAHALKRLHLLLHPAHL